MEMDSHAQLLALARAHGFTDIREADGIDPLRGSFRGGAIIPVPNYLGSLDVIVPMVRESLFSVRHATLRELREVMSCGLSEDVIIAERETALATPRQWCEAYLRARRLWKETAQ